MTKFIRLTLTLCVSLTLHSLQAQSTNNPLAYLDYKSSKLIYEFEGVAYYLTNPYQQGVARFASITPVSDDSPLLDIEMGSYKYGQKTYPAFRLTEAEENKFLKNIIPALSQYAGDNTFIAINHYNKSNILENTHALRKAAGDSSIEPPIRTYFKKSASGWQLYFNVPNPNENLIKLDDGYANTVNAALAARTAQIEKRRKANMSPREIAQEDLAKRDAEDLKLRVRSEQIGVVFRDWMYWQQYVNGDQYKMIFDGMYNAERYEALFPHLYLRFFGTYSVKCQSHIPSGSPGHDYYTTTTVKNGYFESDYERYDGRITVKEKYWPSFRRYHENPPLQRFIGETSQILSSRDPVRSTVNVISDTTKFVTNINNDFELMFANEGCSSSFIEQMEENFFRASTGRDFLQQSQNRLTYFDRDTGGKNTLSDFYKNCLRTVGVEKELSEWCLCLDEGAKKVFTIEEYAKYSKDYDLLMRDTNAVPSATNKEEWRLYNVPNQCRR